MVRLTALAGAFAAGPAGIALAARTHACSHVVRGEFSA
jgi:hypothetical protein